MAIVTLHNDRGMPVVPPDHVLCMLSSVDYVAIINLIIQLINVAQSHNDHDAAVMVEQLYGRLLSSVISQEELT